MDQSGETILRMRVEMGALREACEKLEMERNLSLLQVRELTEACERLIRPACNQIGVPMYESRQEDINHAKGILLKFSEKRICLCADSAGAVGVACSGCGGIRQ